MFVLQFSSQLCLPPVIDKCSTLSVVENVHTVRKFQRYGSFAHYWKIYYTYQEQSSTHPLTPNSSSVTRDIQHLAV